MGVTPATASIRSGWHAARTAKLRRAYKRVTRKPASLAVGAVARLLLGNNDDVTRMIAEVPAAGVNGT